MKRKLPAELVKRQRIALKTAKSDPKFGCKPAKRSVDELLHYGIVNINKPKGPTSHQVADFVKKIVKVGKAGHTGTLDPAVTGVLPVALGRGTRISQALLPAGKEYITVMHLHADVSEDDLRAAIKSFHGKISQKPPVRSAVKRVARIRNVYYADILEIKGRDALVRLGCQGGTYVRKWIHDVGQKLGCGAHMAQLVRTKAGPYQFEDSFTLQDVEDALWYYKNGNEQFIRKVVQPIETGIKLLPKIWVLDSTIESLTHGRDLALPGVAAIESDINEGDLIAVMSLKDELVCLSYAEMSSRTLESRKTGYAATTHKVFMLPGIYPSGRKKQ